MTRMRWLFPFLPAAACFIGLTGTVMPAGGYSNRYGRGAAACWTRII